MADSSILITWGSIVTGREEMSLAVFQEALVYWEGQKKSGKIEDLKVALARNGNFGQLGGYILAEGAAGSLNAITDSEEYLTLLLKAGHAVTNLTVTNFQTGSAIPVAIERVQNVRKKLGI